MAVGVVLVRLRVTALIFRWLCPGVTHPRPPLERGDLDVAFFLKVWGLSGGFPLLRGD